MYCRVDIDTIVKCFGFVVGFGGGLGFGVGFRGGDGFRVDFGVGDRQAHPTFFRGSWFL